MSSAVAQGEYRAPDPLLAADTSTARSSVVVSVGFLFSGILGALLAFVIAVIVGEGAETDGFLAAYVIYLAFVLFGSTLRVALVPLLGPTADTALFRATAVASVRRILAVAGLGLLLLLVMSPLMGQILVPGASDKTQSTTAISIAILAAAAYCQIWSALLSAVLAAVRRFVASAVLYSLSGIVTLGVGASLMAVVGIWGATVGVLAGALTLLAGHLVYMRRFGFVVWPHWRPALESQTWKLAALAAAGASVPLCFQLDMTISLATIVRAGERGHGVHVRLFPHRAAVQHHRRRDRPRDDAEPDRGTARARPRDPARVHARRWRRSPCSSTYRSPPGTRCSAARCSTPCWMDR